MSFLSTFWNWIELNWGITIIALLHFMNDTLSEKALILSPHHSVGPGKRPSYQLLFTSMATGMVLMSRHWGPLPRPLRRLVSFQHQLRTSCRPRPPRWTVSTFVSSWWNMNAVPSHFKLAIFHLLNRRDHSQEFTSSPAERHWPGRNSQVSCYL